MLGLASTSSKKSDLANLFPNVTQSKPLFFQDEENRNFKLGSLRSSKLMHAARICEKCNTKLTQPYDLAWQRFISAMIMHSPRLMPGSVFRGKNAFPYNIHINLLRVHLFFVKALGCAIKSGEVKIPLQPFADALLNERAHPNIYLNFGLGIDEAVAGASDLGVITEETGEVVYAVWFYQVGRLWVSMMYAQDGEDREGMIGAWQPRQGTAQFTMADFR